MLAPARCWPVDMCLLTHFSFLPQVVAAQTGNEAVALLAHPTAEGGGQPIDLVLKAHDLPQSNAVRFLQKLRDSAHRQVVPVIGTLPPCIFAVASPWRCGPSLPRPLSSSLFSPLPLPILLSCSVLHPG